MLATPPNFDDLVSPLLKFYEQAEGRLSQLMGRSGVSNFEYRRTQLLVDQIDSITRALQEKQRGWSARYLPRAYRTGRDLTAASFNLTKLPSLTLMDRRSIEALVARMTTDTSEALRSIAPFAQRVWTDSQQVLIRETQLAEQIALGRVEGLGPVELGARLKQSFKDGATERLKGYIPEALRTDIEAAANGKYVGIMCRDGVYRQYDLTSYSELVANTATRMAATEGSINATMEAGGDLVQISVHSGACEECLDLQGEVFSLTGATEGWPILTDEERPPIHPNCEHVLVGVDEDFLEARGQTDALQEFSNSDEVVDNIDEYEEMLEDA